MTRRKFLAATAATALAAETPRFAHRQASMQQNGPDVFAYARRINGLLGVELQVFYQGTTLHDPATLTAYRQAAALSGLLVPSIAGIWGKGAALVQTSKAETSIRRAIDVAHALDARVILVAAFRDNCPRMDDPASFEPVVAMLRSVAPAARDAKVTLGLETSLSPASDRKLVDLVNHPAVKVYFDCHNTETYGHTGQSVTGAAVLGASRLAQVHCKNEERLLEAGGLVNWSQMLRALRDSGYSGWYTFETRHAGAEQCIADTERNIAFARRVLTR